MEEIRQYIQILLLILMVFLQLLLMLKDLQKILIYMKRNILILLIFICLASLALYPWVGGGFCASYRGVTMIRTLISDPNPMRFAGYTSNIDPKMLGEIFMKRNEPFNISVINKDIPFVAYYRVDFLTSGRSYYFLAHFSCLSKNDFSILSID